MTLPGGSQAKFATSYVVNTTAGSRLATNLTPGLFVNNDPANSVWISPASSVSPNNGIIVAAGGGSVEWGGGDTYACLDAGVANLTPVVVQFSNNARNPSNPVATAEALALIGIPSVLVQNAILSNVVVTSGNLLNVTNVDVHKYSQLIMEILNAGPNPIKLEIIWFDINGTILGEYEYDIPFYTGHAPVYSIPVDGYYFNASNNGAGSLTIWLDGTNRPPGDRTVNLNDQVGIQDFVAVTAAAGAHVMGTLFPPRGGVMQITAVATGAAGAATGYWTLTDGAGNTIIVADTSEMHTIPGANGNVITREIKVPPIPMTLTFNQTSATAAVTYTFSAMG